jgi:hypothetical protein
MTPARPVWKKGDAHAREVEDLQPGVDPHACPFSS